MSVRSLGAFGALGLIFFVMSCAEAAFRTPDTGGNSVAGPTRSVTPMHKVLMTQRGYIQFLRWELSVPEIREFTFCLWVKSTNLTYPHSIFSYSKNDKERLVRSWISSNGKSVHLEIDNVEIFAQPTALEEHRWYHVCQSWDNEDGRFGLWIDGKKQIEGCSLEMAGHVVPSKGDIVVGQEYTDFDKGLEEGIEGAALGFNLLLASAFEPRYPPETRIRLEEPSGSFVFPGYRLVSSTTSYPSRIYHRVEKEHAVFGRIPFAALGYDASNGYRQPTRLLPVHSTPEATLDAPPRIKRKSNFGPRRIDERLSGKKPALGLQLVEESFQHCQRGRGSPRIGGDLMLISWTRTPVKVFGGAIVKNANGQCGQF